MSNYDIYSTETLIAAINNGLRPKYLFFWGHHPAKDSQIGKSCFSQWWAVSFELNGVVYPTAEHYMMAEKARLFGDTAIYKKILISSHPNAAKKLGREVKGFDQEIWSQNCLAIVIQGNEAKFGQNPELRQFLLNTGERILVEASPIDQIWGIGLAENDPGVTNPEKWRGQNLLGFALMKVRTHLRSGETS